MNESTGRTALITGATSGLGYEAAAQLAERFYGRVIITGRNEAKTTTAVSQLEGQTGRHVFESLVVDNDRLSTIEPAVAELKRRKVKIDNLILNAGIAPPSQLKTTEDGFESTVASSLIGHHLLTMRLIDANLLSDDARIVISGSEAARGDVPTFHPVEIDPFAEAHFDGNVVLAIESYMKMDSAAVYRPADVYATTKMFVAWWAAELALRLPQGMSVNAVSPGSTPDTDAKRNATAFVRYVMIPVMKALPGMSHTIATGAARYLEAIDYPASVTGKFFASPPKKMTGPLTEATQPHLVDPKARPALWNALERLVGNGETPVQRQSSAA